MKGIFAVVACVALMAAAVTAQTDDVPKDRCGLVVASNEDERLEIFVLGHDNQIYHKYQLNDKEWSNWASLGGVYIRGGPSVVKAADGRLVLFVRSTDRAIYYKAQTSANSATWTSWQSLGGRFASSPAAILSAEGFLHVFAVGQDRTLLHKFQFDNVTSAQPDWSPWQSLGGSMTSLPSAVIDSEGLLHVFARGPDRALWHKGQVAEQEPRSVTWSDWTSLGGVLASGPRVPSLTDAVGLLNIVVRASDKAYWHKFQVPNHAGVCSNCTDNGVSWSDWNCLGGIFSSGPSVSLSSDGTVELFGRGPDKALWHKGEFYDGTDLAWKRWTSLGGLLSTGPEVATRADGLLEVFARGLDKNIWHKAQEVTTNGTLTYRSWSLLGGSTKSFPC